MAAVEITEAESEDEVADVPFEDVAPVEGLVVVEPDQVGNVFPKQFLHLANIMHRRKWWRPLLRLW